MAGLGGDPASGYFAVSVPMQSRMELFAIDLATARQTAVGQLSAEFPWATVSRDGRQVAYVEPKGSRYSIRLGDAGGDPAAARVLCDGCGYAHRFAADGRFLFYTPERTANPDPKTKETIRLIEIATGSERPWLEHPVDSLTWAAPFGDGGAWVLVAVRQDPKENSTRAYLVPWRKDPVPVSEWVPITIPTKGSWNYGVASNDVSFLEGNKRLLIRFDPRTKQLSAPVPMRFFGPLVPLPEDALFYRDGALVFSKRESRSSVWLMKLPE